MKTVLGVARILGFEAIISPDFEMSVEITIMVGDEE